ncbi:GntR family transcriptional regulator [Nocardiopsis sp. CC223A]|uniref:GntR family transcriptional regulator n=1 Tax=Nocardiopsis sp. CC223A TaxID=3044051 RepID=UPI00278C0C1C|nr:GntR family transcriptional regulator [Nocardiopsis sp. CC223A]
MPPAPPPPPSLRDRAYAELKSRIMGLRLPPGHRITERETAAELGVSRVPLREALRLLEAEGLIVLVPRQGAMVAGWSREDIVHLFEVREELEPLAARLAAAKRSEDDLRLMRRRLDEAARALDAGDDSATAAANAGFHRAVLGACGNPLLQEMMAPLDARVQWLFHLTRHRDTREQRAEHVRLLELIERGDGEGAAALYRAHVAAGLEPTLAIAETWERFDPVDVTRTRTRR